MFRDTAFKIYKQSVLRNVEKERYLVGELQSRHVLSFEELNKIKRYDVLVAPFKIILPDGSIRKNIVKRILTPVYRLLEKVERMLKKSF